MQNECKQKDVRGLGIKLENCLSPLLYNTALNKTVKKMAKIHGGVYTGSKINILAYVDDTVLIVKSKEELIYMTKNIDERSKEGRLEHK